MHFFSFVTARARQIGVGLINKKANEFKESRYEVRTIMVIRRSHSHYFIDLAFLVIGTKDINAV